MWESITPTQLEELEKLLRHQLRGKIRDVRVVRRDGQVVVQGTAVSYYSKQLAQHLVLSALGATPIVNELEVPAPGPGPGAGAD